MCRTSRPPVRARTSVVLAISHRNAKCRLIRQWLRRRRTGQSCYPQNVSSRFNQHGHAAPASVIEPALQEEFLQLLGAVRQLNSVTGAPCAELQRESDGGGVDGDRFILLFAIGDGPANFVPPTANAGPALACDRTADPDCAFGLQRLLSNQSNGFKRSVDAQATLYMDTGSALARANKRLYRSGS